MAARQNIRANSARQREPAQLPLVASGPRAIPAPTPTRSVDLSSHPLVDADHVAAVLCLKRKRVYELARRHRDPLPCVRIGGAVRFVLPQVEEWVAAQSPR